MTVGRADILRHLLHAKKYHYKIWINLDFVPVFGHIKTVTKDKVTFIEPKINSVHIDQIKEVKPFYNDVDLDELDSEE